MQTRSFRGSGEPAWVIASSNACFRLGPDPRRALGPAASRAASTGRTHDRTRPMLHQRKKALVNQAVPHQQAGHMTAPDQCCINVKKLLSIRRRPHMTRCCHWRLKNSASQLEPWDPISLVAICCSDNLEAEDGRVPRLGKAMRRRDFIKALGSGACTRRRRVRASASWRTARCHAAGKPLSRPSHQCVISRLKYEEESMSEVDGATLIARSLKQQGIDHLFGVVGFPVTPIATAAQKEGVAYIGVRNEQAASYAAQAYGYLTGRPGACIVVTGPGVVHGLAGLANAQQNCWPMILFGGASETYRGGMGAFQEERQVLIASPFCKFAHGIES